MASNDVQIVIQAKNLTAEAFDQIVKSAKSTGQAVEESGKKGAQGLDDLEKRATAVGAAFGAVAAGFAKAGQVAYDQRREIDALDRIYGQASIGLQRYAKDLQNVTNYSDEQARQAAITASTLSKSYGVTVDQVELLISRSADLAQVYGRDLSDVIERTSAAVRGEAESAEALSITLNDTYVAAQAAARGLTGWNTTMSDSEKAQFRLQLLLEQTATLQGSAAEAAEGARGKAIDLQQAVQDNIVAFGEWLGPLGESLSSLGQMSLLLPVITGGVGKLTGALSAAGIGAGALGPLALVAGGGLLAYGYSQDSIGNTATNKAVNEFFLNASKLFNYALPGSPFDTSKYTNQMAMNDIGDALLAIFGGGSNDDAIRRANLALGNPAFANKSGTNVFNFDEKELKQYIQQEAAKAGITVGEYLLTAAKGAPGLVYDPVSQTYKTPGEYADAQHFRYFTAGGNLTSGATTMGYGSLAAMGPQPTPRYYGDITQTTYNGPYQPNTESSGGMGIGAKGPSRYAGDPGYGTGVAFSGAGGESATGGGMQVGIQATDITPIIERERDAYYGLATAQQVAAQGLSEFKAVQDSILSHEGVYSDQVSEYTSQLNAQDAAYEILKQRQEDGVALTKEQTDFMNNYAEATARGTAGVEDATVAQGLLAQQYLLNMEKGDQLNASLENQTGAVGDLVTVIEDLILSLDGVPDEVRARIELDRVAESEAELQTVIDLINQIEGEHGVHFSISADGGGVSIGNPNGPTISPELALHGGVMGYRGGGVVARMAEGNNPELLRFRGGGTALALTDGLYNVPLGTYVTPAPATKQLVGGGNTYQFYAPLTIVANDPGQFAAALQEAALGSSR